MNIISSLPTNGSVAVASPVVRVAPVTKSAADSGAALSGNAAEAAASSQKLPTPTAAQLQQAVDQANKVLEVKTSNELRFSVDDTTNIPVVKMINQQTGETLLQFPSEAMLQIAKSIDQVTGAIIRKQA